MLRSGDGPSRSRRPDDNDLALGRIETFQLLKLLVDEVGVVLLFIPHANELQKEQWLRKCSHLFWSSLCPKGKQRCLQIIVNPILFLNVFATYQTTRQPLDHLPDAPILQTLPNL